MFLNVQGQPCRIWSLSLWVQYNEHNCNIFLLMLGSVFVFWQLHNGTNFFLKFSAQIAPASMFSHFVMFFIKIILISCFTIVVKLFHYILYSYGFSKLMLVSWLMFLNVFLIVFLISCCFYRWFLISLYKDITCSFCPNFVHSYVKI